MALYRLFSHLILWITTPFLMLASLFSKNIRDGLWERYGFLEGDYKKGGTVFCCASVGEVNTIAPVIREWKKRYPKEFLIIASTNIAGCERAVQILAKYALAGLRPIDAGSCPRRWLDAFAPKRVILVETELWPIFLDDCKKRNIDVGVMNGRLSDRSFPKYKLIRGLLSPLVDGFDPVCVQTEIYRERFISLGADPDKVQVCGNLKFASAQEIKQPSAPFKLTVEKFTEGRLLIIAGSTHQGEEEMILQVFGDLLKERDDITLLLAPRHMKRLSQVVQVAEKSRIPYVLRSQIDKKKANVMILDTMGELSVSFAMAQVAVIGGSFADIGGHNLLEPAVWGVPVLFGPHIENFKEESALLEKFHGGKMVQDPGELFIMLKTLIGDNEKRQKMGQNAKEAVNSIVQVLNKTVDAFDAPKRKDNSTS